MPCRPEQKKIKLCISEYGREEKERKRELDSKFKKIKKIILEKDKDKRDKEEKNNSQKDKKTNKAKMPLKGPVLLKALPKDVLKRPNLNNPFRTQSYSTSKNKTKKRNKSAKKKKKEKTRKRSRLTNGQPAPPSGAPQPLPPPINLRSEQLNRKRFIFITPTVKTFSGPSKECKRKCDPVKSFCNPKTGRCNKKKKRKNKQNKTRKKKKYKRGESISLTVKNKESEDRMVRSFSPSINKQMISLQSYVPNPAIYNCKKKREIRVMKDNGDMKCMNWKHPLAQRTMLKNLFSKEYNRYTYEDINTPKQYDANCWMNAMLMVFFISDKGRKFFRHLRKSMISGRIVTKKTVDGEVTNMNIPKNIQWPLFMFNKYIDAVLQKKEKTNYSNLLNTNNIIKGLHKVIKTSNVGKAGNPLELYTKLIEYLSNNEIKIKNINVGEGFEHEKSIELRSLNSGEKKNTTSGKLILSNNPFADDNSPPHVVILKVYDIKKGQKLKYHLPSYIYSKDKNNRIVWKLDSGYILDEDGDHFASLITFNGEQIIHDGYMKSRHVPLKWKDYLLNKNVKKKWRLSYGKRDDLTTNYSQYSFGNSNHYALFYYRV